MTDNSEGSEPIKLTETQRIEKEADEYVNQFLPHVDTMGHWLGYIAGANAERERYKKLLKAVAELLRYDSSMKYAMTEKLQHWEIFVSVLDSLVAEFEFLKSDSK